MSETADQGIKLGCDCVGRCSILCVDFWGDENPAHWYWDFYTDSSYEGSWRHRLGIVWNLLRGKDHYFHGTTHSAEDMRHLRDFLNATLPSPMKITTTDPNITYSAGKVAR